jgi:hypothetical protein
MIEIIGSALAIIGSLIACIGIHFNNQRHDHIRAMELWSWSNPMLCVWSVGWYLNLWGGAIPVVGLTIMYSYYWISNYIGLRNYKRGM